MAEINKPSDINKIWASAGDVLAPSDSKIATGWSVEIPPRQWFNYIDHKQDAAIAHINQHGIAVWDSNTEYQWTLSGTKSICMGSNGTIYRTKQLNINQNPVLDVTSVYWEVAFTNISDFYDKTQTDGRYLQKSSNLSDLTNTATARSNLSVYSQTQVDNKTTVASALQTQQQASNSVLMTPVGLSTSFQGANQALQPTGFQKFPGGMIIQWFSVQVSNTTTTFNFPIPFPNAALSIATSIGNSTPQGVTSGQENIYIINASSFSARVIRADGLNTGMQLNLQVIGF